MNVNHHLDDATLVRYASGDLDEAFLVVAASHLAMCADCRAAARAAEEVGGELLESLDFASNVVSVKDTSFEALMQRIDAGNNTINAPVSKARQPSKAVGDVPLPLQDFIGSELGSVQWKTVAPGVRKHDIKLNSKGAASLYMLHIAPGMAVPEHGHGGEEVTLILSGVYRDALGDFGPGDVADLDEHVEHQPKVISDEPCICLVAMEAPTRFKGLVEKIMQPFIGI